MVYIILICINSVLQTKLGKGIYWKGRSYGIRSSDYLKLLDDDLDVEVSENHPKRA
jgi:hypothetical protein